MFGFNPVSCQSAAPTNGGPIAFAKSDFLRAASSAPEGLPVMPSGVSGRAISDRLAHVRLVRLSESARRETLLYLGPHADARRAQIELRARRLARVVKGRLASPPGTPDSHA